MHRKLINNPIWFSEKFTRGQAWVDMILLANHEDSYFYKRGVKIDVKRGQLGRSEVELSDRWKWSRSKVRKFLNDLEKEQQIIQQKTNVTQLVTIVNYDNYQQKEQQTKQQTKQQKDSKKTPKEQQKDTYKNDKKEENEKNVNKLYDLYPSKCVVKNSSTGKSKTSDLAKIDKLLKVHSVNHIEKVINWYISECKKSNVYMKNFGTFLNNLPDIEEKEDKPKEAMIKYSRFGMHDKTCNLEDWPELQKKLGPQITKFWEVQA